MTGILKPVITLIITSCFLLCINTTAKAQSAQEIQKQVDELKLQVTLLKTELAGLRSLISTSSNDNSLNITAAKNLQVTAAKDMHIEAADEIAIKCGNAVIILKKNGDMEFKGNLILPKTNKDVLIKGNKID